MALRFQVHDVERIRLHPIPILLVQLVKQHGVTKSTNHKPNPQRSMELQTVQTLTLREQCVYTSISIITL